MRRAPWFTSATLAAALLACGNGNKTSAPAAGSGSAGAPTQAAGGSGSAGVAAGSATPPGPAAGSGSGSVAVEWHIAPATSKDEVVVSLVVGRESHALGTLQAGGMNGSDHLGCEVRHAANHLGEAALLCHVDAGGGHAMRARIRKGRVVVSTCTGTLDEGDIDYKDCKRIAKWRTHGTELDASADVVVDPPGPAQPSASPPASDKPCHSDADCGSDEQCQPVRDLDDDGRTGPVTGQICM